MCPDPHHPHGAPRVDFENKLLAAGVTVLRPGWVYGLSGGQSNGVFFKQIDEAKGTVTLKGKGDKQYSWVHVTDLAEGYLLAVNQDRSKVDGLAFNLNANDYPTYEQIILAAAKVGGLANPTVIHEPAETPFLETKVVIDPKRAREVLGWVPKHKGFVEEMDLYYPAWKLFQKN